MFKKIKKLFLLLLAVIWIFYINSLFAWYDIIGWDYIKPVSNNIYSHSDVVAAINYNWFKLLAIVKLILQWLMLIFIVYTWWQMIWSMWDNEEELNKAKKHLWYVVVAVLFLNVPWTLYNSFHKREHWLLWDRLTLEEYSNSSWEGNMFFDFFSFWYTYWDNIIWFLEVIVMAIAILVIIYESIKLIYSRWREERVKEAKNKVIYAVLALVFITIIEFWKRFAFDLKISQAQDIFSNLANFALFFAAPTAFFFLTIAAYYYITSSWEEEKVKKAKSIIINTVLATLILLASYTFLLDLALL